MDFRVAPQAEFDLDEIWHFLATQSSSIDVADRVVDSISAASLCLPANRTSAVAATKTCDPTCVVSWSETM